MTTEIEPADVAEFLREVADTTTKHQRTITEQTKDGFACWCAEAATLDGVRSLVLERPDNPLSRFLELTKPGTEPGPKPVEPTPPEAPEVDAGEAAQQRYRAALAQYEVDRQRYEEEADRFRREHERWQRHRTMYESLFAARNPPDALEVVVAVGLLVGRDGQHELRRHLAVAPAAVELDRDSGRLTVELTDAFKQEVNWLPPEIREPLVEEAGVHDLTLAETLDEVTEACGRLVISLGTRGAELSSPTASASSGVTAIGSHPAVLVRKKDTSSLLQLLKDMAADMADGGFVSDPFRMIVDPRFVPSERPVRNDRAVLPLPANTDQRSMIDRARTEAHMVVQGPPGTGKTHTIANLAAVLMAEGRRVLITAENDRALTEVQSKLPKPMRPLLLPMLRERGTDDLSASVNELTDRSSSTTSSADRQREIDERVAELGDLDQQIATVELRLTQIAKADLEERRFGETTMRVAGHQQALAKEAERLALVDRFLSPTGRASAEDADVVLELSRVVDEVHERMRGYPLPEGLLSPGELGQWLQGHHGALATLGDPGPFDHSTLATRHDELEHLARMLHELPPTSWSEIRRTDAEYDDAATRCADSARYIDHGVTVEPSTARPQAVGLLEVYLALDQNRFDRPVDELLDQYQKAVTNAALVDSPAVFTDTSRSNELTRSAQAALDLLTRDQSGLLVEYVRDLGLHGRSRVNDLVREATGLVANTRNPFGLPVEVAADAPPPHELLDQAEVLHDHLASGGKLTRTFGTPRAVKDAAGLLEHVRVAGSTIDTPEESARVVEFFAHRKALALVDAWTQQHHLVQPPGIDHHTWLTAIVELPQKAAEVQDSLKFAESLLSFPTGGVPDDPAKLLQVALASVAREVVMTLGPLAQTAGDSTFDVRVDGFVLRSQADARRAIAALKAADVREQHHELLPTSWRQTCNPLDVEDDTLVDMLRVCAAAAAVTGPARTADLTPSAVEKIVERTQIDIRRAELRADHDKVIGGMRRVLAGCVPKSPATSAIDRALVSESAVDYRVAIDALEVERAMAKKASQLARARAAIEGVHPDLMAKFDVGEEGAALVLETLEELQTLRDHRAAVHRWRDEIGSTEAVHRELSELHKRFRRLEETIAGLRCWSSAIDRLQERRDLRSALSALTTAMDKVPKTRTAKSYASRMRALRDATRAAAPAIPCWVMPIERIADVLGYPTGEDRFDVVIVDESSQAWFTASFLYAIADQVIIVGDNLQTSPDIAILNEEQVRAIAREHIPGHRLENQVGADLSLYDVAAVMTGPDVMVDHFRCVPEIIELSNRLSYEPNGKRLLPSRVREPGSLPPIVQKVVRGERSPKGANVSEVEELVETVAACHANPAYAGMDFGVVVVGTQPTAHLAHLRTALLKALGPQAMADRNLEVGTPSQFQGSERNVMFLSLVDVPIDGRLRAWPHEHTGKNRRRVQQLNVAVSRARDQLWIFRSFGEHDLAPNDARVVLLQSSEAEFPTIESQLELCDSQFERDVVTALATAASGVRIRTQVEAIGYRIDIVVEDGHGHRLAVECDGDRWHSSHDQIRKDLHRHRTLESIGWTFERFLASEWYDDPAARTRQVLERLQAFTAATPGHRYEESDADRPFEDPEDEPVEWEHVDDPDDEDDPDDAEHPFHHPETEPVEWEHVDDPDDEDDEATSTEAARVNLNEPGRRFSGRVETLTCESCATTWTRPLTRGRKPRFCEDCR